MSSEQSLKAEIILHLSSSYPDKEPTISIRCEQLSKNDVSCIKTELGSIVQENVGQPMLLDLISKANEELSKIVVKSVQDSCVNNTLENPTPKNSAASNINTFEDDSQRICLLHLDHMRAKSQYVKLIKKWTAELQLKGYLIFCQRLIVILLQGSSTMIKVCISCFRFFFYL